MAHPIMMWVRQRWTGRMLAAVLIASTLATFLLPTNRGVKTQFGTYERWIRAQLRIPVDEAVEQAIAEAAAQVGSFEEFVSAFLKSYEEIAPGQSTARAFIDRDLSNDALLTYLHLRFTQVVGDFVLLRVYVSKAASTFLSGGKTGWERAISTAELLESAAEFVFAQPSTDRLIIVSMRILSSARSLGP